MKFVNDYLNDEEMKEFEKRALPYPSVADSMGIIGYDPYVNDNPLTWLRCTLDREAEIYLFYCGMEQYDFETIPQKHYFTLIGDKMLNDLIITFVVERDYLDESITGREFGILWKLVSLNFPSSLKERKEEIKNIIKNAMSVYGIDGDPEDNVSYAVEFDFEEVI